MKKMRSGLIKLMLVLSMALFCICAGVSLNPMLVYAQSHEDETVDKDGPIINAAISNGKLRVEAFDEAGVKAIYVNDYEFTDIPDGILSIRLQQFDSGYDRFRLSAVDNLGNQSFDYYIDNPYFSDGEENKAASELPADAQASKKSEAKAEVKDYTEVSGDDGSLKLFYTFETENGKKFYLIIDRAEGNDVVHFVTDVSENDLLNTTADNSETLPKNSAALLSNKPINEMPKEEKVEEEPKAEPTVEPTIEPDEPEPEPVQEVNEDKPMGTYIVIGIVAVIVIAGAYYFKVVKKKENFIDEDDEDEEVEEYSENDDFFSGNTKDEGIE